MSVPWLGRSPLAFRISRRRRETNERQKGACVPYATGYEIGRYAYANYHSAGRAEGAAEQFTGRFSLDSRGGEFSLLSCPFLHSPTRLYFGLRRQLSLLSLCMALDTRWCEEVCDQQDAARTRGWRCKSPVWECGRVGVWDSRGWVGK